MELPVAKIREGWHNAFYRYTVVYIAVIVTLIFAFQMYRYFVSDPVDKDLRCIPSTTIGDSFAPT